MFFPANSKLSHVIPNYHICLFIFH